MTKSQFRTTAAAAAMTICAAAAIGQGQAPAMTVGISTAKAIEHIAVRKYNGHVIAQETVAIVPQVAGEIKAVLFKEGAYVKEGDILYTIDKVKYESAVASSRATVAQARASAEYAGKTFERTKALFEKKVASDDDMDSAASAKNSADAALAAAEAALVAAEDNLAHCSVTAPISGRIGLNKATVGNYVSTASGAMATIVRTDPMRLAFSMSARDFAAIYGGEAGLRGKFAVKVILSDESEYPAEPVFDFVENTANASTDTVTVYYTLDNPDGALLAGMSVKVTVTTREASRQIAVPTTSVVHSVNGDFVYVIGADGIPQRRAITTAGTTAEMEFVSEGLAVGETIVTRGTHKVFPGMPVNAVSVEL